MSIRVLIPRYLHFDMKIKKTDFVPNLAYGKLQYAIKVYRDYFYNHCFCTDRFGCYVGENDEKIEFIVSEGYKPSIKRFESKKKAKEWLKSNSWKL